MTDTIICPGCGAEIPPDPAGEDLACPKCGTVIPNPEAEGQDPSAKASMALAADRVAEEAMPRVSAPSPGTSSAPEDGERAGGAAAEDASSDAGGDGGSAPRAGEPPGTRTGKPDGCPGPAVPELPARTDAAAPHETGITPASGPPPSPHGSRLSPEPSGSSDAGPDIPVDVSLAGRGREAMARSDLAAAEDLFKEAAAVNPESYEAWKGLADCLLHRPAGGVFKGLRMIDFLKADIKPSFVESALDTSERGKRVYLVHKASGALLAAFGPDSRDPRSASRRTVSAVILGPSIHRYGGFVHSASELAAGRGRDVLSDWEGFRSSFAASQEALRTRLVTAARLAPKGREAELMMEYAYRFLDQPMAMADICAGGRRGSRDLRCFIATAVYGNPFAPEVVAWRRFRDGRLMPNAPGRALVRAYYALSPALARRLSGRTALNRLARRALDALAGILTDRTAP